MMRITLIAVLATFVAIAAYAAAPCDVNWSTLIAPYDHPETATDIEWGVSKQIAAKLMRECPAGPTDDEGRGNLFEFAKRQLSLDYVYLTPMWESQGKPLSEGGEESVWAFEKQLRQYISSIADPKRDARYANFIVKEGVASGLAKFGRSVAPLVERQVTAKRPVPDTRKRTVHSHDATLEAIRTFSLWIAPNNPQFSVAEKRRFSRILLGQLPKPDGGDRQDPVETVKILAALGYSDDEEIEKALVEWTNAYMRHTRSKETDSIPRAAYVATNAIAANRRTH